MSSDKTRPVSVQPRGSPADTLYTFNNQWNQHYFGSFTPCPRSAFACFCSCCYVASLIRRTGDSRLSCICNPCAPAALRTKVRTAFHIRGTLMEDCYKSICVPCSAMQIEKELDHQNIPARRPR